MSHMTYNIVTKSEQGYLTTGKMLRMLISGVIYIKQADALTAFSFRTCDFAQFQIKIRSPTCIKQFSKSSKTPLRRYMRFNDGSRSVYHQVNPIILFYNVNWD